MLGDTTRSSNEWGNLPLVIDTSVWPRTDRPGVKDPWQRAVVENRLRIPPAVRLELLFGARDLAGFDLLSERLSNLRSAPLTASVVRAAEDGMRALAQRSAGAHRLPLVDYLVAAAAQQLGAAVLHYDADYDTLAEVMEFESVWLAPRGSLD